MLTNKTEAEILMKIASRQVPNSCPEPSRELVQQSVDYLNSDQASVSLKIDAYWPKWNSPWWHMLLLHEMGMTKRIPQAAIEQVIDALNNEYLKDFPLTESEIPPGIDPIKNIACHCQLGTIHQVITAYGIDCDQHLPWVRARYLKFQMNDGGLNCDEAAYTKPVPTSSIVSTVPPMEAILHSTGRNLTDAEISFLDLGASYLISKKLFRRSSNGEPINEDWLKLCFPRFYYYDVLRGLSVLLHWSLRLKRKLPAGAIQEVVQYIDKQFPDGIIQVQGAQWYGVTSRFWEGDTRSWSKGPATTFSLLTGIGQPGVRSAFLTKEWSDARANLAAAIQAGLVDLN